MINIETAKTLYDIRARKDKNLLNCQISWFGVQTQNVAEAGTAENNVKIHLKIP